MPKFALTARQSQLRCRKSHLQRVTYVMKSAASFFFALAFALAIAAPAQAARLDGAFRSGDFPRAVKSVGPAAERGASRAQAHLRVPCQSAPAGRANYPP